MMVQVPMLADFAVRLAFGLVCLLLVTSWRDVPVAFFRTHCVVALGLLVLAVLDLARTTGIGGGGAIVIFAAAAAYLGAVAWGLGLPRVAYPLTLLIALASATWLGLASRADTGASWPLELSVRLTSGLLIGSTLSAMLLGHHYLISPTMSIAPLRWYVAYMGWSLAARIAIALLGLVLLWNASTDMAAHPTMWAGSSLWPLMRWGMGFVGTAVALVLAWKTVQIRSTQSATGILYVALALVLFGELTSMIMARSGGPLG